MLPAGSCCCHKAVLRPVVTGPRPCSSYQWCRTAGQTFPQCAGGLNALKSCPSAALPTPLRHPAIPAQLLYVLAASCSSSQAPIGLPSSIEPIARSRPSHRGATAAAGWARTATLDAAISATRLQHIPFQSTRRVHITLGEETVRVVRACMTGLMGRNRPGCSAAAAPAGCESGQGSRGGMGAGRGYHWLLAISFPPLPCCPAAV